MTSSMQMQVKAEDCFCHATRAEGKPYHKGLKFKRKFSKGFSEEASGYGPTDRYRNMLVKSEASLQLHKKEQITMFSFLAKAELLRAHT